MRLKALVEYDGTDFAGWQRQSRARSVQGVLEEAIGGLTGEAVTVVGAGRTDAGVHAVGQAAHFDTLWQKGTQEMRRAVNARLPEDVAVIELSVAPPGFHARYSAVSRTYAYRLCVHCVRRPLARRTSLHVRGPLDVELMARAARQLVGTHDFASFGRPLSPGGSTIRRLLRFDVRLERERVVLEVEGRAFLRHHVRRMVGLLVDIGRGKVEPGRVAQLLERRAEADSARRVPAHGLMLVSVQYPPDEA